MGAPGPPDRGMLSRLFGGGSPRQRDILLQVKENDAGAGALVEAAMAVQAELGGGYSREVYAAALAIEFGERAIPFEQNVPITVAYRGHRIPTRESVDFVCGGDTLVIVRAATTIDDAQNGELIATMKATGLARGVLFNFGAVQMDFRRVVSHMSTGDGRSSE